MLFMKKKIPIEVESFSKQLEVGGARQLSLKNLTKIGYHLTRDRNDQTSKYWVAIIKPGRILCEMGRVTENIARLINRSIQNASNHAHLLFK